MQRKKPADDRHCVHVQIFLLSILAACWCSDRSRWRLVIIPVLTLLSVVDIRYAMGLRLYPSSPPRRARRCLRARRLSISASACSLNATTLGAISALPHCQGVHARDAIVFGVVLLTQLLLLLPGSPIQSRAAPTAWRQSSNWLNLRRPNGSRLLRRACASRLRVMFGAARFPGCSHRLRSSEVLRWTRP